MAGQTLQHTGAAIVDEYYPRYASDTNTITPLYSSPVYLGSAIILVSMCMLGLPLTAVGYHNMNGSVDLTLAIVAVVLNVVVFLVGLGVCWSGFRKYKRQDAHH